MQPSAPEVPMISQLGRSFALACAVTVAVACGSQGAGFTPDASRSDGDDGDDASVPEGGFGDDAGDGGCDPGAADLQGCPCKSGDSRACYSGPASTRHVGTCADGTQTCVANGEIAQFGPCKGETLPGSENCSSTADTNCNGKTGCKDPTACPSGTCQALHKMAAGGAHTCIITPSGGLKCWGWNGNGQLGNGTMTGSNFVFTPPVDVIGLSSGVVGVTAGEEHTCALMSTGAVKCWGACAGPCGAGVSTPMDIPGLGSGVVQVAAGEMHTCALLKTGDVECWGTGGEFEPSPDFTATTPTTVPGLSKATAIASGDGYACALFGAAAQCWGGNMLGELGAGSNLPSDSPMPLPVSGLGSGVLALGTLGGSQTCAIVTGGALKCWGSNDHGQLGNSNAGAYSATPLAVTGLGSGVTAVAASGEWSACAVVSGGVQCWGDGSYGQLGNGTVTPSNVPVGVTGLSSGIADVVTGDVHGCARTSKGAVQCWGVGVAVSASCAACATNGLGGCCTQPVVIAGL
jgi:alpha-tubulin suppressor-like RCC1 family protein